MIKLRGLLTVDFLFNFNKRKDMSFKTGLGLALLLSTLSSLAAEKFLTYKKDKFLFDFGFENKMEAFYEKNGDYLSGNWADQTFYCRSTWDFTSHAKVGDVWKSKVTLRNKANWGTTRAVETTQETVRLIDVDLPQHSHGFNRLVPWFRKAWVKFSLNDAFDINADCRHYLKIGIFPYEVGRGISLGSAYAVTPGFLGFFTDNSIDQFAWGALWHGDLCKKYNFTYDVYGSIVESQCDSIKRTTETIYTNCLNCGSKYRGFGHMNFILAGRSQFVMFNTKDYGMLTFEPYVVYNQIPEQKVDFVADSNVRLGTFGVASEYVGPRFELGFDTAVNCGRQAVKAWDRNKIVDKRNSDGVIEERYTQVFTDSELTTHAVVSDANKDIVESQQYKGAQYNGQEIVAGSGLYNGNYRFRKAYRNIFNGYMFVVDAAWWMNPDTLKLSWTAGYASGDENPNLSLYKDSEHESTDFYDGFLGLQEIYSGKRVRSLYVLGQVRVARALSAPSGQVSRDAQRHAHVVSGFNNLIYTGVGLKWTPKNLKRKVTVNPNALYYWLDVPGKAYYLACQETDTNVSHSLDCNASRRLGLELNFIADVQWLEQLKGFIATAVFVPGAHFSDTIGKPTNEKQYDEVHSTTRCGIPSNGYPLVNRKVSGFVNLGFECSF